MKRCLFWLLLCLTWSSWAQFQDNFADGDFTTNPTWSGEVAKFTISSGMLRLNDVAASTAYLETPSNAIHNASWEFYVQMDFNTSSSNYAKVYLVSDQANLYGPLNGYYLSIGGTTTDKITLYRQTGSTSTLVIDGLANSINFATVKAKIKVTRDASGTWSLYRDVSSTGPTGAYTLDGTGSDVTHTVSSHMGVSCVYTISRATSFYFDDFIVSGTVVPDMNPPAITNAQANSATEIEIAFNEPVEANSAQLITNYLINNSIPDNAVLQPDNKTVLLTLASPLVNGLTFSLRVNGVQDLDGNAMGITALDILYFKPFPVAKKDIVVSEFMADPSPAVGLPEAEFVELFNRSANPIQLLNWKLTDGTTTATLPNYILLPGNFVVITTTSAAAGFNGALGVASFPSLNNTGDNIVLKTDAQQTIDSIYYTTAWYHSEEKQDGGWSLEIIDPENPCEEEGNWAASENATGGTPGIVNAVNASNPDLLSPTIESAVIESSQAITIRFNEKLDGNLAAAALLEPLVNIATLFYTSDLKQIKIITTDALTPSTRYTLTLSNVSDCSGNALVNNHTQLILPEAALPGDVLLNEVLFNPKSGGVDFVEVYNTSEKYIGLKKWSLANIEGETAINLKTISMDLILNPKSFMVFTTDPTILKAHYPRTIETTCVVAALPSMNDDEGTIALVDSVGQVLDFFFYRDDYHVAFLKDDEGVSLERVSLMASTNDPNNWRSASQFENFATPGYKNSASTDGASAIDGDIVIEPEIFSPQVPPTDFTTINYKFNQSGKVVNAQILDHQGRLIKTLANNEVLGTDGFFRWDGDRDDGGRARAGYYVAWIEVFDASGKVSTFRKRVVVSFR